MKTAAAQLAARAATVEGQPSEEELLAEEARQDLEDSEDVAAAEY